MDWAMGILGAAAGGGSAYATVQKEQRQWNMDQVAKQADLDRQLHLEQITGDRALARNKELAMFQSDEKLYTEKQLAIQRDQYSMSPTAVAARKLQSDEAIALEESKSGIRMTEAEKKAKLQEETAMSVAKKEQALRLEGTEKEFKLKKKLTNEQLEENIKYIDTLETDDATKQALKIGTQLTARGIPIPEQSKNLKPSDVIAARNSAVSQAENAGDPAKVLAEKFKLRPGKDFTKNTASEVLADVLTSQNLKLMGGQAGKKGGILTPEPPSASAGAPDPAEVKAQLAQMKPSERVRRERQILKNDPEMAKSLGLKQTPLNMGSAAADPVSPEPERSENPAMSLFGKIGSRIGDIGTDFKQRAAQQGWTVR